MNKKTLQEVNPHSGKVSSKMIYETQRVLIVKGYQLDKELDKTAKKWRKQGRISVGEMNADINRIGKSVNQDFNDAQKNYLQGELMGRGKFGISDAITLSEAKRMMKNIHKTK